MRWVRRDLSRACSGLPHRRGTFTTLFVSNHFLQRNPQYPTDAVQYDFQPTGDGTVGSQQALSFIFNNVEVNRTPGGPCKVVVTEGSNDCQPPACPTKTIDLTKFPAGWGTVAFWAEPDIIPSDGSTTLKWAGPGGATYTIDYYTSATGP